MPDLSTNADVTFTETSGDLTARSNRLNDGTNTATAAEVRALLDKEGAANGLATLNADGTLTETEFPAYVRKWFDTQAAIQAEVDRLGSTGGVIRLAPTEIEVSKSGDATGAFTQPYGIRISASEGPLAFIGTRGVTKLTLADSQEADTVTLLIRGASGAKRDADTYIYGITFNGNSANQTGFIDYGQLHIVYADNVFVDACRFEESPVLGSQCFRNSQRVTYYDCEGEDNGSNAVIRTESPFVTIDKCRFDISSGGTGLDLSVNGDIDVPSEAIHVTRNQFWGGLVQLSLAGTKRAIVDGNFFWDVTNLSGNAIRLGPYTSATNHDALHNLIANNQMYNVRNGVNMAGGATYGVKHTTILGNHIVDGPGVNLVNGVWETGTVVDKNVAYNNRVVGASTAFTQVGASSDIAAANNFVFAS